MQTIATLASHLGGSCESRFWVRIPPHFTASTPAASGYREGCRNRCSPWGSIPVLEPDLELSRNLVGGSLGATPRPNLPLAAP